MKKIFAVIAGAAGVFVYLTPAQAKPASNTCTYIQDGTLGYATGHYLDGDKLSTGYDVFGYNYQAHLFNGTFANAYLGRPDYGGKAPYAGDDAAYLADYPAAEGTWMWPFRNVQLQMKWNDAWLANSDCDTDGVLDRHYGFTEYKGSGAWLTNHATGEYTSTSQYNWDVAGDWVIAVNGGSYLHDYTFAMTSLPDGTFTGTGGYPAGASDYTFDEVVINGQITGNNVSFTASYYVSGVPTGYSWDATGQIDSSGHFINGTGTSGVTEWHSTVGAATKVYKSCTVSDFVKIIAPPADAYKTDNVWYTADDQEIGPDIWGEFAIIQEESSDPCGEYGVINYLSPLKAGLGNWK